MTKDNRANLKAHHGAHSEPQRDILTMIIRLILQVVIVGSLVIFGLSLVAACQPKTVIEHSSKEGQP
ncbi:hypothetical protein PSAR109036_00700 [Psychrobacter arenosus]